MISQPLPEQLPLVHAVGTHSWVADHGERVTRYFAKYHVTIRACGTIASVFCDSIAVDPHDESLHCYHEHDIIAVVPWSAVDTLSIQNIHGGYNPVVE